jgi:hypothetical protein
LYISTDNRKHPLRKAYDIQRPRLFFPSSFM